MKQQKPKQIFVLNNNPDLIFTLKQVEREKQQTALATLNEIRRKLYYFYIVTNPVKSLSDFSDWLEAEIKRLEVKKFDDDCAEFHKEWNEETKIKKLEMKNQSK